MEDSKKERSRSSLVLTNGLNQQKSEVGRSKGEVSQSSQYPRAAMLFIGDVEDAKNIDDVINSASVTGRPIPDYENLDF